VLEGLSRFGSAELIRHRRELQRLQALVKNLFGLEVTETNLDEVVANWNLLHTMSSRMTCQAGFMVLSGLVWTDEVRMALALARTITHGIAPYPPEVVKVFKARAAKPLRENYLSIVAEIDIALAAIERIQRHKMQAYNLMMSALTALFIGIFSFLGRIGYDMVRNNPEYRARFHDIFLNDGSSDSDSRRRY
jgi:hypothetical protein